MSVEIITGNLADESDDYERGYADACDMTNDLLDSVMNESQQFQKLHRRYADEIRRLRTLLGLPPFPLLEEVPA